MREEPPWWEEPGQRDAGQARPRRIAKAVAAARFSQLVLLKIWVNWLCCKKSEKNVVDVKSHVPVQLR